MVVLNRIYTRTGDDGTTALGSGERRPKYDLRVAAYGTVDETNAVLGLSAPGAHGMPPGGTDHGGTRGQAGRAGQRRRDPVCEPPVGFPVCRQPLSER